MSSAYIRDWSLPGADDEPILVTTHAPSETPRAAALLAHGFKGYKDYGFLPILAESLAATAGVTIHRFNFSHSGMTEDVSTFARPELFERDTWNKQVFDLDVLTEAVRRGNAPATPHDSPLILIGHSRGGASCLLAAGRAFRDGSERIPAAIVTLASPDRNMTLDPEAVELLERQGYLISPSVRTGQNLRIGRGWLEEEERDPENHDLLALASRIACPVLVIHGEDDQTVEPSCAARIADACPNGQSALIPACNHVFNTPNPADPDTGISEQLGTAIDLIRQFFDDGALRDSGR